MIGTRLAHYEISRHLGSGGMGDVYQATDTKLGRRVAIKLLPGPFALDGERVARFEREARVLASLNHANIAVLYGMEQADGKHFLVMELVEGETLADRIMRGALPVEEALKIAHQIGEALEAAHDKGVIHRDLKPANVKITPEGKVKVLDFGLAKAMQNTPANATLSNSPTLSIAATAAGVILGTAPYMSPEQAKGAEADSRSDVFSFGCVLYEMLTRRQPFQGDTTADILASVLAKEPDLSVLPPNLNPRIRELLRRCLDKNPKNRWHAVADMRVEIESILADPRGTRSSVLTTTPKKPFWKRALPVIAGTLGGALIAFLASWYLKPAPVAAVSRSTFVLPEGQNFGNGSYQLASISPDGTQFVYVANSRLFLKLMSDLSSTPIQGTEIEQGIVNPVFSPDGRSLAFWSGADQTLKRIAVSGGAPITICKADPPFGMSWGENDQIVFGQAAKGIMRVSADGGEPETIATVPRGVFAHGPQLLPDGDTVLFTMATDLGSADRWEKAQIVVQSLRSSERRVIIDGGRDARYLPTGHLIYALSGKLLAVPFDSRRLVLTGEPVRVIEDVRVALWPTGTGSAQFSISQTGSLIYIPTSGPPPVGSQHVTMAMVDRAGNVKPLSLRPGPYDHPRISPDGKQLLFATNDGKERLLWIYDLSGTSSSRRLTFGGNDIFPIWSRDGQRVLFTSDREGDSAIYWQRADGTGSPERLTTPAKGIADAPNAWAPQSQVFSLVAIQRNATDNDIWLYSIPNKKAAPLVAVPSSNQGSAMFSIDERWIAYESNESGQYQVYAQPYPTGSKFQITKEGGHHAFWSRDGKELFFVSNSRLFSVKIQTQPTFTFSDPVPLPIMGFLQFSTWGHQFDMTSDGKQFIMLFPPAQSAATPPTGPRIHVVLNWFTELQQRVSVK